MKEPDKRTRIQVKLDAVDGFPLVSLDGECDAFSAPFTHGAISGLIDVGHKGIIIDLTNLKYIDAAGFHALDDCCTKIKVAGGELILVNPRIHVEEIYEILRTRESCVIMDTIDEALARLNLLQNRE